MQQSARMPSTREAFDYALNLGMRIGRGIWNDARTTEPDDGEEVIIREYYKGAKTGRLRTYFRSMIYDKKYGFQFEEQTNRRLKLRITHWMPAPILSKKNIKKLPKQQKS